jgi:hypothetical protein
MPPPLGSPGDSGIGDLSPESVLLGDCPGSGKVSVTFDGGSGENSCWSGFAVTGVNETTVSLAGNVKTPPGLGVGIVLYEYEKGSTKCLPTPGATFPLDGPCVFVSASYLSADNRYLWQAFGGSGATSPLPAVSEAGKPLSATGSLMLGSYGSTMGSTVGVTFSAGSTLVVNVPGYPSASITGSAQATVE